MSEVGTINGTIYRISNRINGKVYIGQTRRRLKARFNQHKYSAGKGNMNSQLHKAFRKYGVENFCFMPIHTSISTLDALNSLEVEYIKLYNAVAPRGYNTDAGGGSYLRSEETLCKMSSVNKGRKLAEETKELIRKKATGRATSAETKRKISIMLKGNKYSDPGILRKYNEQRTDKTEYSFTHPIHGVVTTYPADLAKRFDLECSACHNLATGKYKGTRGWSLLGGVGAVRGRVYEFANVNTNETVVGDFTTTTTKCRFSLSSFHKLTTGKIKQTRHGWEFKKEIVNGK